MTSLRKLSRLAFVVSGAVALLAGGVLAFGSSAVTTGSANAGAGDFALTNFQSTNSVVGDPGRVQMYIPGIADGQGVDTGIPVAQGDSVEVTASGTAACGNGGLGQGCTSGPDGIGPASPFWQQSVADGFGGACEQTCADHAQTWNVLAGAIGQHTDDNGFDLAIGSHSLFTAASSGDLFLIINDVVGTHFDNTGGYSVDIKVNGVDMVPPAQAGTPVLFGTAQNTSTGEAEHITGMVSSVEDYQWAWDQANNQPAAPGSPEQVCHDFITAHPMQTAVDWATAISSSTDGFVAPVPGTTGSPKLQPQSASAAGDAAEWSAVLGLAPTGNADVSQLSPSNTRVDTPCAREFFTYNLLFTSSLAN